MTICACNIDFESDHRKKIQLVGEIIGGSEKTGKRTSVFDDDKRHNNNNTFIHS